MYTRQKLTVHTIRVRMETLVNITCVYLLCGYLLFLIHACFKIKITFSSYIVLDQVRYVYTYFFLFRILYNIMTKFSPAKISLKAHTMYWSKNFTKFNVANHASYLPGRCGWSLRMATRICACTHDRTNMSKFSLCKKSQKKFRQWHALAK